MANDGSWIVLNYIQLGWKNSASRHDTYTGFQIKYVISIICVKLYCYFVEKTKENEKVAGDGPHYKNHIDLLCVVPLAEKRCWSISI